MQVISFKYGIILLSMILLPYSYGAEQLSNSNKTVYIPYNFKTNHALNYIYNCEDTAKYIHEKSVEFRICGETFSRHDYTSEIIYSENIDTLNIKSIKWITKYKKETASDQFNHHVFEQVYIVEYLGNDRYITYE
jgi:hypothetical protein